MKVSIAAAIFSVFTFEIVKYASATFRTHPNWPHAMDQLCGTSPVTTQPSYRVVKGEEAKLGQFPWLARIYARLNGNTAQAICAGTLVTSRHVITAAHCTESHNNDITIETIVIGEWDISTNIDCQFGKCAPEIQIRQPWRITVPDKYSSLLFGYDIAVILLNAPVVFNDFVIPACLPDDDLFINFRDRTIVAGWGLMQGPPNPSETSPEDMETFLENYLPKRPQFVGLIVLQSRVCDHVFPRIFDGRTQICASNHTNANACLGDSGGPLIRDFDNEERGTLSYLSGVVSFGNRNCAHGPAVYTRVTAFLEFILNNLGNE